MERNTQDALGAVIKDARKRLKLTREQYGEILDKNPRYIMAIENEGRKPSFKLLVKMIHTLGVDANAIFYPSRETEDTSRGRLSRLLTQCDEHEIKVVVALVESLLNTKAGRDKTETDALY